MIIINYLFIIFNCLLKKKKKYLFKHIKNLIIILLYLDLGTSPVQHREVNIIIFYICFIILLLLVNKLKIDYCN